MNANSPSAPAIRRVAAGWRHAFLGVCFALCGRAFGASEPGEIVALAPWIVSETTVRTGSESVRASALVPEEAWSGRALTTLADAFRFVPGAILQESFGGLEPPRLSIRGSGVQSAPSSRGLALRLEQLPLGLADGSFNSALFDPQLGASVEVQRGLDGWRSAPATLGGALDLRGPRSDESGGRARFEAGSFGARRARAAGALAPGASHATAALAFAEQDGFREHSAQRRSAAFIAATRDLNASTHAAVNVYHAHARYEVPGPLTLAAMLANPRRVSADVRRDLPERRAELTRVAFSLAHAAPETELEAGVALARTDDDFRQLQANGVSATRSDDAHARLALARRFATGALPHRLRATAAASRGWRDLDRFANDGGATGTRFGSDRLTPMTATLQVEDAFAVTRTLVGTVGLARVVARRDIADRLSTTGAPTTRRLRSGATLPQASVRWHWAREAAVFASVSRAAEPPTFDDLFVTSGAHPNLTRRSQPLATQRALTYEIGARSAGRALTWDLAVYHSEWRNEILRLADARGVARGAVNASPTTHQGVEASLRWRLVDRGVRAWLTSSAVWTRFTFDDDPVYGDARLAGFPPHLGAAELLVEYPNGFYGAIGADWTAGATRVDHAGRLRYGGRTLGHARLGWRGAREWTVFAEGRNLFDHASIASTAGVLDLARNPAATSIFLPAPGRAWTVGLEWRR